MNINLTNIIFFEDDCNFCNVTVQFIFDRNPKRNLYYTSQLTEFSKTFFKWYDIDTSANTIYFYANEKLYDKSEAFFRICKELKGIYHYVYYLRFLIPKKIADVVYGFIAKRRHFILRKKDNCKVMKPSERKYFIF